ncbi:hypothetical protein B0T25DRAFT_626999 [Lasiosphaeria hispida]|uniref:Accumulation-associated protein n=1 Tax=Lasiosphaeria hispida TaxID=260671 RepID=A0AAJ0MJB0_9PEZI|nr:hypothetical protein B0T25DRAFT_626999 [Lasiosphaeria hispida]
MKFSTSVAFAVQVLSVLALPKGNKAGSATSTAAATATSAAAVTAGEEEAKDPNKIDQVAQFGQVVQLGGGNIQTDTTFPPGIVGVLEVEFANQQGRAIRVTENKSPAKPPAGFTAIEPSSYIIEVQGSTAGVTLQKVDFIRNANSTVDISTGKIGKLCTETKSFVIDDAIGELEFEADENELTLTVSDLVGEWGIFLPAAAATAGTGAAAGGAATGGAAATDGAAAGGAATAGACGTGTQCRAFLDQLLKLVGQ